MARDDLDHDLRDRIRAWTVHLKRKHEIPSDRKLAKRIGVAGPTVTNILAGGGMGLDYVAKLHRAFHVSADVLLDDDPPIEAPVPVPEPRTGLAQPPRSASSSGQRAGRRRGGAA